MTRPVTAFVCCCMLAVWILPGSASGEPQIVFFANYDINLFIDGVRGSNQASAQVRDGHTIPVDFQSHRVDITISSGAAGKIRVDLKVFEKSQDGWFQMNAEKLAFEGELGVPVEYAWNDAGVALDLALVASVSRYQ